MSNKTIFKRIALVAITALGAGVLSTAPALATNNSTVGAANPAAEVGFFNVATMASLSGDAETSTTTASNKSLGLLAVNTVQDSASLSSTATMTAAGELVMYYLGSATAEIATTIVVDGGVIDEAVAATGGAGGTSVTFTGTDPNGSISASSITVGTDAAASQFTVVGVKPNAGVSSFTVSVYESAALATGSAGAMTTAIAGIVSGATSKGTLKQRYTITVAAVSGSGKWSAANSYVVGQTSAQYGSAPTTNSESSSSVLAPSNASTSLAYIAVDLKDAYDVSLDGLGALIASTTGGAGISWSDSYSPNTTINNSTAVTTNTSGLLTVARPAAAVNKNFATTVTITWNGVTVATKSINFRGEIAKLK